jgi:putative tricarboxylic transport membrane protein
MKAGMNRQDQVGSLVWLLLGAFIIIVSLSTLTVGTVLEPGPGLFPLGMGSLLSFLSLITLAKAFFEECREDKSLSALWSGLNWSKTVVTLGALLAYLIVLNTAGFVVTTLLLLLLLLRVMERQGWIIVVGLSILGSVGSYLLFERLLQIPFPKGFWGL